MPPLCGFHSLTNRGLDRTWLETPLLPPWSDHVYHHLECDASANLQASPVQIMNRGSHTTALPCLPASGNPSFSRKVFICQQRDNVKTLKTNQTEGRAGEKQAGYGLGKMAASVQGSLFYLLALRQPLWLLEEKV